uniref:Gustatory receptor n=1 Tax=Heliothis virescens TaxID=7102 RepID=A0A2A4IU19_HELVI
MDFCKILNIIFHVTFLNVDVFVITMCYQAIMQLISLCSPMLILERAANDLDEIKKTIARELLVYEDYNLRSAVYESMEFIDEYTMGLNLWNQYPLNVDIVLTFIGFITAYMIAILQFSF